MTTPPKELIELIDRAALAAGSQAKAARAAGISPQHVSHWRTGIKEAPPEGVAALAHIAGLNATEWLARATLWRAAGKPYESVLRTALGKMSQATGGAIASFFGVATLIPLEVFKVPQCILAKVR